jgi:hypothetical protein
MEATLLEESDTKRHGTVDATTQRMDNIKAIQEEFEQVLDETQKMVWAEQLQLEKIKRT